MVSMPGVGSVYMTTVRGVECVRAARTFVAARHLDGAGVLTEGKRVQLIGTAPGTGRSAERLAVERLQKAVERYHTKQGQRAAGKLEGPRGAPKTVGDLLSRFIENKAAAGRVGAETMTRYRSAIRDHLAPHVGQLPLAEFGREHAEHLFAMVLPAKRKLRLIDGERVETNTPLLGASAIRTIYDLLSQAVNFAIAEDWIVRSPLRSLPRPAQPKRLTERTAAIPSLSWLPTAITACLFEQQEEDRALPLLRMLMMFYGLRQSEALGLQYSSFRNLTRLRDRKTVCELDINRQLARRPKAQGGPFVSFVMKTPQSNRTIPIPSRTHRAIGLHALRQQDMLGRTVRRDDLLFSKADGSPLLQQKDNEALRLLLSDDRQRGLGPRIVQRYRQNENRRELTAEEMTRNLPDISGHGFRHLATTFLQRQTGINSVAIGRFMGHAATTTTERVYTHLETSDLHTAAALLEANAFAQVHGEDWPKATPWDYSRSPSFEVDG